MIKIYINFFLAAKAITFAADESNLIQLQFDPSAIEWLL